MSTITFYRQARQDGGVRTGIEIDRNTVLARFDAGGEDADPALLWYVDVECKGKSLPSDAGGARDWLIANRKAIQSALNQLAAEVAVGIDAEAWPLHRVVPGIPGGIQVRISCSAIRRLQARDISQVLRGISTRWESYVKAMRPIEN
jgi:hypothetical protein